MWSDVTCPAAIREAPRNMLTLQPGFSSSHTPPQTYQKNIAARQKLFFVLGEAIHGHHSAGLGIANPIETLSEANLDFLSEPLLKPYFPFFAQPWGL